MEKSNGMFVNMFNLLTGAALTNEKSNVAANMVPSEMGRNPMQHLSNAQMSNNGGGVKFHQQWGNERIIEI